MANWSLREIGRPCSGPIVLPVLARWSSTSLALARARSMNISVRQFDYMRVNHDQAVKEIVEKQTSW